MHSHAGAWERNQRGKASTYNTMKASLSSPDYGRTSLIQAYTLSFSLLIPIKPVRRDEVARRAKASTYHTMKASLSSPDYGRTSLIQAYTFSFSPLKLR
jgi:ribosomal protein L37E